MPSTSTSSSTGKYFKSVGYGVSPKDHLIDFDELRKLALEHRPKILRAGTTAFPRQLDFAKRHDNDTQDVARGRARS